MSGEEPRSRLSQEKWHGLCVTQHHHQVVACGAAGREIAGKQSDERCLLHFVSAYRDRRYSATASVTRSLRFPRCRPSAISSAVYLHATASRVAINPTGKRRDSGGHRTFVVDWPFRVEGELDVTVAPGSGNGANITQVARPGLATWVMFAPLPEPGA